MTIPSWARVGAKVVCVDDSLNPLGEECGLVSGNVYTVAAAHEADPRWTYNGQLAALELVEVSGRFTHGFRITRFRPLVVTKTEYEDVAKFTHLLNAKVDA